MELIDPRDHVGRTLIQFVYDREQFTIIQSKRSWLKILTIKEYDFDKVYDLHRDLNLDEAYDLDKVDNFYLTIFA